MNDAFSIIFLIFKLQLDSKDISIHVTVFELSLSKAMVKGRKDSKITPEVTVTEKDIIPGAKDKSSNIPPKGKTHNLYDYICFLGFIYL